MKTVIEMAREAGITFKLMIVEGLEYDYREVNLNDNIGGDEFGCIERFAELVRADERERIYFQTSSDFVKAAVAEEREACAKVVEASPSYDWHKFACEAAAAIRARRTHD